MGGRIERKYHEVIEYLIHAKLGAASKEVVLLGGGGGGGRGLTTTFGQKSTTFYFCFHSMQNPLKLVNTQ